MKMTSRCVDAWNPDHELLVTWFFEDCWDGQRKHDPELGNGLLLYHHQLMHDVLTKKLRHPLAMTKEKIRADAQKIRHALIDEGRWDEARALTDKFENKMEDMYLETRDEDPCERLSWNQYLKLCAAHVQANGDLTFTDKYSRLLLGDVLGRTADIALILQGPPPNASPDDWKALLNVRTELRDIEWGTSKESWDKCLQILDRRSALRAKIGLCEWKVQLTRMQPRNLLSAVENLSQSLLGTQTWEDTIEVVKQVYPLLRECDAQLPHTRELLRAGQLVERAYEQLLKLVRDCLERGEVLLQQQYPRFMSEYLYYGNHESCMKFLNTLTPEERDETQRASKETSRFYDFLYLHDPDFSVQERCKYRTTLHQDHVFGYCISSF